MTRPQDVVYDIGEGDVVTLPDGDQVVVGPMGWDETGGVFFSTTEKGEDVWYYASILVVNST